GTSDKIGMIQRRLAWLLHKDDMHKSRNAANGTPWTKVRKWMTEEFCPRSVLQRLEQELYNLKLKGTDIDGYTNLVCA
ncbi:hypothetical protein Tco_1277337, partial [Tanacetum coccineum]